MTDRQLVIVDTETTSLDTDTCGIVEVAAINATTGETLRFVPYVAPAVIAAAHPYAMELNGYYSRNLAADMLNKSDTTAHWDMLREMLVGNTFGGSNPKFDVDVVSRHINRFTWHHRLADLAAYVGGALHLPPHELPGLDKSCELLGVTNTAPHTALGDAKATLTCFRLAAAIKSEVRA